MPASTLQLVSYGAQDMYLTGNPQITYFKIVYRRHTNFSMEDILLKEKGKGSMRNEETLNIEARKYGDLFHKLILSIEGNLVYQGKFLANPSTALIDHVSMNLDGHEIDKLHGDWIETWYELTKPNHNGTCSNLTYINDHSLTHLSSSMDLALCHYDRHSIGNTLGASGTSAVFLNEKDHSHTYYNTRLNKLTNIMGLGLSYPPTQFQKTSKCGGVFCSPSYLIDNMNNSSSSYTSASYVDYAITDTSLISASGSDGLINASNTRNQSASGIVSSDGIDNANTGSILGNCTLDIPFYFSKDPGLSIPLISLQTSSLIFNIKFNDLKLYNAKGSPTFYSYNGTISNPDNCFNAHDMDKLKPMYESENYNFKLEIFGLYIYLDTDERRRFAQISHEYLIEQVQFQRDIGKGEKLINLDVFTHPVKEIIWIGQPYKFDRISNHNGTIESSLNSGDISHNSGVRFVKGENDNISGGTIKNTHSLGFGNASDTTLDVTMNDKDDGIFKVGLLGPSTPSCLEDCKWELKFDEQTRTGNKNLQYYTRSQIERYHTGYGSVSCPDSIAVYSFALKPEEHQPSGTCNFSKINKVTLCRSCIGRAINVYAVNYNILRIAGGQASLAYNL